MDTDDKYKENTINIEYIDTNTTNTKVTDIDTNTTNTNTTASSNTTAVAISICLICLVVMTSLGAIYYRRKNKSTAVDISGK
jgi:hypothetical protein